MRKKASIFRSFNLTPLFFSPLSPSATSSKPLPQPQEATFAMTTNDPSGFNAIDTLAWGAIGHALGYFALATNSLSAAGFDAKPF